MRLSGCIELLFKAEHEDYRSRILACRDNGLEGIEFWRWRGKDIDSISRGVAETGLAVTSFVSDPSARLVDPATHAEFLEGLRASVALAKRLGASRLTVLSGNALPDVPRSVQRASVVKGLKAGAPIAADAGVTLVLEPINTRVDHPGAYLDSTSEGLDIVEEVDSAAVRLLYDVYHSAVMGEETSAVLRGREHLVGHVQIADAPGRHEPGTGDIDWAAFAGLMARNGYRGPVGLEYVPHADTATSIASVRAHLHLDQARAMIAPPEGHE